MANALQLRAEALGLTVADLAREEERFHGPAVSDRPGEAAVVRKNQEAEGAWQAERVRIAEAREALKGTPV